MIFHASSFLITALVATSFLTNLSGATPSDSGNDNSPCNDGSAYIEVCIDENRPAGDFDCFRIDLTRLELGTWKSLHYGVEAQRSRGNGLEDITTHDIDNKINRISRWYLPDGCAVSFTIEEPEAGKEKDYAWMTEQKTIDIIGPRCNGVQTPFSDDCERRFSGDGEFKNNEGGYWLDEDEDSNERGLSDKIKGMMLLEYDQSLGFFEVFSRSNERGWSKKIFLGTRGKDWKYYYPIDTEINVSDNLLSTSTEAQGVVNSVNLQYLSPIVGIETAKGRDMLPSDGKSYGGAVDVSKHRGNTFASWMWDIRRSLRV